MFRQSFGAIIAASLAFLSLAGAIVGITVSATNMKNDFEAAKARVAELEGQVAALQRVIDKPVQTGTPGASGPAGPQGPRGEPGPPGPAAELDESALRRLVTAIVRDELSRRAGSVAPAALGEATTAGRADRCIGVGEIKAGALVRAEEGAKFCASDGAVVMEVKDIVPGGQLAVGMPGDPGKWCKQCPAPWRAGLTFRAETVEPLGNGYTAMLRFAVE